MIPLPAGELGESYFEVHARDMPVAEIEVIGRGGKNFDNEDARSARHYAKKADDKSNQDIHEVRSQFLTPFGGYLFYNQRAVFSIFGA
jgi:hypothetical protein